VKRFFGTPLSEYAPALALLAITLIYLITGYTYSPAARAFPVTVAWVMIVLVGLDLLSRTKTPIGETLIRWLNPAAAPDKKENQPHYPVSKQIASLLWLAGFVATMVLLGILPAVAINAFASMLFRGRRPLWLCLLVSASVTAVIWFLFEQVLKLELYRGVLFGAL
jgi:hypothetical protein